MAGHQMIPPLFPPQPTDHTPEPKPPAGPQSNSNQADFAPAGQEVTSADLTSGADTDDREVEQMKEGEEAHISTSGRQNEDEGKEQEGETEENGEEEEEEEEEEELGNWPRNFPVTGQRSDRSSGQISGPPASKYNTVCYRKIKRGNTKQRNDEFEFMMNV